MFGKVNSIFRCNCCYRGWCFKETVFLLNLRTATNIQNILFSSIPSQKRQFLQSRSLIGLNRIYSSNFSVGLQKGDIVNNEKEGNITSQVVSNMVTIAKGTQGKETTKIYTEHYLLSCFLECKENRQKFIYFTYT